MFALCNNAHMQWDDLRYVLAISRMRTLSQTAQSLGVTHTTVGRRLKSIEERLGVRLFDRTPDGFMPTPAGQDIGSVAERMESEVLSLEGRVRGRDVQLSGKLRVSTMDFLFIGYHHVFASFLKRYPSVELTVSASNEEVSLTRREADVVIRMNNAPPEFLVGRKVGKCRFGVYGANELVERIGADAPYSAFPWLHFDERMNPRWMDMWLQEYAPGCTVSLRIDNTMVMRQAIRAGIGVQLLPTFNGDSDPGLTRIGPLQEDYRDLWLLTLPDLRNTSRVKAFMEHMDAGLRPLLA